MNILYLSQYFPPERGATQTRAWEMATGLIKAGHRVTMLTEMPNHPQGIIHLPYRGRFWMREKIDGIDVIRVWVKSSPVKTQRSRLLFYVSYLMNAVLRGLALVRERFDMIYASSPPLFVGGAALALNFVRGTPLVFEVRDLWPESAVALGELKNPIFARWATWLEEKCYRESRHIVVVTEGIRSRLIERNISPEKVTFIPNGANTELFSPQIEAGFSLRNSLQINRSSFLVVYAGILGIAQGLGTILEAAHRLLDKMDIQFLFVGDGPCKGELLCKKQELGLSNVSITGSVSREKIPAYLSAASAALVPLRRLELFKGALPSKMFDAWACACPVILSIDGEARKVLERAQGGVFVEPESPEDLANAIRELSKKRDRCRQYGLNGRRFVEKHYSRQDQACQLARLLEFLKDTSGNDSVQVPLHFD